VPEAPACHGLPTGPDELRGNGLGKNPNLWLDDTVELKTVGSAQPLPFHSAKILSPAPARII
jgi:hypothetical protein